MKKNGRKYRKISRKKEMKEQKTSENSTCPQLENVNTAMLAMSHIVVYNPILFDDSKVKSKYISRLKSYVVATRKDRNIYEKAELCAYEKIIVESCEIREIHDISFYKYFILFDFLHIIGYDLNDTFQEWIDIVLEKYYRDFPQMKKNKSVVNMIFESVQYGVNKFKQIEENPLFTREAEYISKIKANLAFKEIKPFTMMVTATMSAGKSTFINAVTGKYISLSQNMACTSKIHCIVNKAFEDGFAYEYDHDLNMTAGKEEILNDNDKNLSDVIVVGTSFNSCLGKNRVIFKDSPGVNFSGDDDHRRITNELIESKEYDVLIYLMNVTQLGTMDESAHLEYVRKFIGEKPIYFVINKIDSLDVEEENITSIIQNQIKFLEQKGFKNPIVCPVSSKAGYLAKKYQHGTLTRIEKREFYNYIDKLEQMQLSDYYNKYFPNIYIPDSKNEEIQLLKNSGLLYVENILNTFCEKEGKEMTQIYVKYNPYRLETIIKVNGREISSDSILYKVTKGKRLQEWIGRFPKMLRDELNTLDFSLEYCGMALDWDDFEDAFEQAQKENLIRVSGMRYIAGKNDDDINEKIVKVFQDLQEGPIDEFRDAKLIKAFENINNSIFPVNVIATMSSGKSTLINALLGRKLMPSQNEACTATITEILDIDEPSFAAVVYNEDDAILQEVPQLTYEIMNELNDNTNVHRIFAEGDIPFLDSKNTALMLVDTPGPNNAQNQAHKNTTYRALNSDSNNLILYVLNGTQLSTNDDAALLHYVANQIKKGGKQVRDRFLFVINKMDQFNPQEESIGKAILSAKRYLASYGIDDPQLFPCSAFTALNIKTYLAGIDIDNLTRAQERQLPLSARETLSMIDKFLEFESMHLEKYSTLSPSAQQELNFRLSQAIEAGDTKEQALIHSGIYSIEAAITAYVKKYAKTKKVKDLVESFQEVLESSEVLVKAKTRVATDEEAARACAERAAVVRQKIADGKEAELFKQRIATLDPMSIIGEKAEQLKENYMIKSFKIFKPYGETLTSRDEAKRLVNQFSTFRSDTMAELTSELESVINNAIVSTGERLLMEYQEKLSRFDESSSNEHLDFQTVDLIKGALKTMRETAESWTSDEFATETVDTIGETTYEERSYYEKVGQEEEEIVAGSHEEKIGTRKVKVGSHREKVGTRRVKKSGVLSAFARLFGGGYTTEDVYETVDDYKNEDVYKTVLEYKTIKRDVFELKTEQIEKFSAPVAKIQQALLFKIHRNLDEGIESALVFVEEQIEEMKIQFSHIFSELDEIIQAKYAELEKCATDESEKRENLRKNQAVLNWIEINMNEINTILDM